MVLVADCVWGMEPVVVGDGTVLVVRIGATVAAATGVTVLKSEDFCAMVWSCGFWAPRAGCEGRVMRVAASLGCVCRWIVMVAGGGWMVSDGRPVSAMCAVAVVITGDWALVAETVATTVGGTAVEVVTAGRDWIGW